MPNGRLVDARSGRALCSGVILLAACWSGSRGRGRANDDAETGRPDSAAALSVAQDTLPFAGTEGPLGLVRRFAPPAILGRVATAGASGYERIVFEFAGDSAPGYAVAYSDGEVRRCGSGEPVTPAGTGTLLVRLEPAQAHDDSGRSTLARRAWAPAPALAVVRELMIVCDFEGQVEFALGLAGKRPYRVLTALQPPRVIVDVRRRD